MWKIIVLFTIVITVIAQKATYENYKVFRIIPTTEKQLKLIRKLRQFHDRVSRPIRYININI